MCSNKNRSVRAGLLALIAETNRKNEEFLHQHAVGTYAEILNLSNDSIASMAGTPDALRTPTGYASSARAFLTLHILPSFANGILTSLLVGNAPACFMQLRTLLEAMATCWYTDQHYPGDELFSEKLKSIDDKRTRMTDILEDMETAIETQGIALSLWRTLSNAWIHSPMYATRMVETISRTGNAPSWALIVPALYKAPDLGAIQELGRLLSDLRMVLAKLLSGWPGTGSESV